MRTRILLVLVVAGCGPGPLSGVYEGPAIKDACSTKALTLMPATVRLALQQTGEDLVIGAADWLLTDSDTKLRRAQDGTFTNGAPLSIAGGAASLLSVAAEGADARLLMRGTGYPGNNQSCRFTVSALLKRAPQ